MIHGNVYAPVFDRSLENNHLSGSSEPLRENLSKSGRLGVRLLEDLTALASGGSVRALHLIFFSVNKNFFTCFANYK